MTTIRLTGTALDARQLEDGVRAAWAEALADPRARALLESEGVKDADAIARAVIAVDMGGGDYAADWVGRCARQDQGRYRERCAARAFL
ncbi:hypothetical protein EMQ25_11700 [Arsenicitalea aurantiaca]|uniref:Uncharacterized protein n=1 Tax=Arsenicitalea aurantiaca TaxID=1783274 RepID=A0A433X7E9_9HYPH|nr:hypothetical protein EMQ25_11700 [Arsenicitalea aurantiaca]